MTHQVRLIRMATALALVASLSISATASAAAPTDRWTGADYCVVQNDKNDWASVGGASCNPAKSSQPSASWKQALILDFTMYKVIDAYREVPIETYDTLEEMLDGIQVYASDGWMWVANEGGNGDYVFNLVKTAACAGNSDWAIAPACE